MSTSGLEKIARTAFGPSFDHPLWRPSCARGGLLEAPPPLDGMVVHYVRMCSVWCGLHGALGALSFSVEEGRSTFGVMVGI